MPLHKVVFVEDFNIDVMSPDTYTCEFLDAIHSYGCENIVHQPARVISNTESSLDPCITNFNLSDSNSGVLSCDPNDQPAFFFVSLNPNKQKSHLPSCRLYRNISNTNITAFHSLVAKVNWIPVPQENNQDVAYNLFMRILKDLYDICFPLVKARKCTKARKPWIKPNLLGKIRE